MRRHKPTFKKESYGFSVRVDLSCESAKDLVTDALRHEGFGILTEIDVQKVLADKLGINIAPYLILGACNPALAHAALAEDPNIGLLLPCNVVIRQEGHSCVVSILDPAVMAQASGNLIVRDLADLATERVQRALERLCDQSIE